MLYVKNTYGHHYNIYYNQMQLFVIYVSLFTYVVCYNSCKKHSFNLCVCPQNIVMRLSRREHINLKWTRTNKEWWLSILAQVYYLA